MCVCVYGGVAEYEICMAISLELEHSTEEIISVCSSMIRTRHPGEFLSLNNTHQRVISYVLYEVIISRVGVCGL